MIEVHVADLKQLFHSLDPTPFQERDLDPKAEEFIASWARELSLAAPLALVVHIDQQLPTAEQVKLFHDAVREYFAERAFQTRRRLRLLFRVGRTSLMIGLVFLATSILAGDLAATWLQDTRFAGVASLH